MSLDKYRSRFPFDVPEKCREEKMEKVLEDIKFSKDCFVVFTRDDDFPDILYSGLNEHTLSTFVVLICKFKQFYKFLKMALITAEHLMKDNKKGMVTYNQAVKFCKENFCAPTPSDTKEG